LPFMAEKRLVVVRDYPMLASSSRGSGLDAAREAEELEKLITDFPNTTCLVFLQRFQPENEKTDKNKPEKGKSALWKRLEKSSDFVLFSPHSEEELIGHLGKMAKRAGCSIRRDTAGFMLGYCGTDLEALSHEMEKACAHAGAGAAVSREDIEEVCVQTQESKIFRVIDCLFAGKTGEAMRNLRRMAADDDGAAAMMALIERQARLLAAAKAAGPGADARTLAPLLGLNTAKQLFVMEAAIRQAVRWTGGELAEIISLCVKADMSIKQGFTGAQTAVEQLAMNVTQMAGKR